MFSAPGLCTGGEEETTATCTAALRVNLRDSVQSSYFHSNAACAPNDLTYQIRNHLEHTKSPNQLLDDLPDLL